MISEEPAITFLKTFESCQQREILNYQRTSGKLQITGNLVSNEPWERE